MRIICPDCRKPVRVVRSDEPASRSLLFCEDEACGWEQFVNAIPSGVDYDLDEDAYSEAAARSRPGYRRRGY
ncbi:MAG: hypothetical protein ACYC2K_10560 [Gemmatimonadales bacterium]